LRSVGHEEPAWGLVVPFASSQWETKAMADKPDIQGEGNYAAARRYRKAQEDFAENGPVEQKAREAGDALDGPEGAELEKARKDTAKGRPH
jgi:hypothetical protein